MNKILRLEITDKCNQKCKMCWSNNWKHNDMDWESIKNMIQNYSITFPKGTIVLTSREPLLSKWFDKVLDLSKKMNIELKLLTNGTLLNDYYCKLIVNSSINFISVSIHGSEKQHDSIVGVSGSYSKVISGLKLLNEYKNKFDRNDIETRITTVITPNLIDNIEGIVILAKELKTSLRIQHLMWHSDNIKGIHKEIIQKKFDYYDTIIDDFLSESKITSSEVKKLVNNVNDFNKKYNIDIQFYPNLTIEEIDKWYSNESIQFDDAYCDHVSQSIRIRANGDVALCQYIDKCYGNIKENKIDDIITNEEYDKVAEELKNGKLFPICMHCCHLRTISKVSSKKNSKI